MTIEAFQTKFVAQIPDSKSRPAIHLEFNKFIADFSERLTTSFTTWIGGSFTTLKSDPNDIDVLLLVDGVVFHQHSTTIRKLFTNDRFRFPLVDFYFLPVPETPDRASPLFRADLLYWEHQFGFTRKGRNNRRHPRGYVEITFNHFYYGS